MDLHYQLTSGNNFSCTSYIVLLV